jgi:hypothetical protein
LDEEVSWSEFVSKFKPSQCKVVEGKLVCDGLLDGKKVVCEIGEKDGKQEIACFKKPIIFV